MQRHWLTRKRSEWSVSASVRAILDGWDDSEWNSWLAVQERIAPPRRRAYAGADDG